MALGDKNFSKANKIFGNQITLTLLVTLTFVVLGLVYLEYLIPAFGVFFIIIYFSFGWYYQGHQKLMN